MKNQRKYIGLRVGKLGWNVGFDRVKFSQIKE